MKNMHTFTMPTNSNTSGIQHSGVCFAHTTVFIKNVVSIFYKLQAKFRFTYALKGLPRLNW